MCLCACADGVWMCLCTCEDGVWMCFEALKALYVLLSLNILCWENTDRYIQT